jgi:hypothetical protein
MAWLMLAGALACFVLAIVLNLGTPVVLLLLAAALVLLLLGASRLIAERIASGSRAAAQMLDPAELQRLREQAEARRQASEQ